jgi:hypothetical protein
VRDGGYLQALLIGGSSIVGVARANDEREMYGWVGSGNVTRVKETERSRRKKDGSASSSCLNLRSRGIPPAHERGCTLARLTRRGERVSSGDRLDFWDGAGVSNVSWSSGLVL